MTSNTTVLLIPGFGEYPETKAFADLILKLQANGLNTEVVKWPYYPENLNRYSISETIKHTRRIISSLVKKGHEVIIHTNSMGSIIGIIMATEFPIKKLSMTVPPYHVGSKEDLNGKYKNWRRSGIRKFTSSRYGELSIPFSFIEDATQYNAMEYINEMKCPVLFITGKKDTNVPWKKSRELFNNVNSHKIWHCINGMEHRFQYQEDKLKQVNEIITNFIAK